MSRHLFFFWLFFSLYVAAYASSSDDDAVKGVSIEYLSGDDYSRALTTISRIEFSGGMVQFVEASSNSVDVLSQSSISSVSRISFKSLNSDGSLTASEPVKSAEKPSIVAVSADQISIHGLQQGASVSIFDLGGRLVLAAYAPSVSLASLSSGVYIIKADSLVAKIIRK